MHTRINPQALDRIRLEHNIKSDTALAERLGVSRNTVKRWRDGGSSPHMAQLAVMVTEYGIPFKDLVIVSEPIAQAA